MHVLHELQTPCLFSSIRKKVEDHMIHGEDVDNAETVAIAIEEIVRQHRAQVGSKQETGGIVPERQKQNLPVARILSVYLVFN